MLRANQYDKFITKHEKLFIQSSREQNLGHKSSYSIHLMGYTLHFTLRTQ